MAAASAKPAEAAARVESLEAAPVCSISGGSCLPFHFSCLWLARVRVTRVSITRVGVRVSRVRVRVGTRVIGLES